MKLEVYNISGEGTGKQVELSESIFGIEPNEHVVYLAVKQYLASQRQGTHKAKERGEITGSTAKIKKQKGTGTARAGSIKSGVFRGGGRIFGPRPRNYGIKLNKKVSVLARKSALSSKINSETIKIIEDFTLDGPKTKDFVNILSNFGLADEKSLLVSSDYDKNLYLSSRNVKGSQVRAAKDLNVYDVLNAKTLLISESAIKEIEKVLG